MLQIGGVSAASIILGTGAISSGRAYSAPAFKADPFSLGVASGDPLPDGVVLWTRLAPDPLAEDGQGGMPQRPVRVRYEVAKDERFRAVVRRGTVEAGPDLAHSVHGEVRGLQPGREYYYRFMVGGHLDLLARRNDGYLYWVRGDGHGGLLFRKKVSASPAWNYYNALVGIGDVDRDGRSDLLARHRDGSLNLFRGRGDGQVYSRQEIMKSIDWSKVTRLFS